MPDLTAARSPGTHACTAARVEPSAPARAIDAPDPGKASAILGGQASALDRIRQQQGQSAATNLAAGQFAGGLAAASQAFSHCYAATPTGPAEAATPAVKAIVAPDPARDFLASARIRIRHTPFNDDWSRVSSQGLSPRSVTMRTGLAPHADDVATLSRVNGWANQTIDYVEDSANYGMRDYWATASETLQSGRGDCEDFAILKYQALAALGFDRSRMYLTLARDLVRNADHAVLIVQIGGTAYMLDNATDTLLPADIAHDYRPVMSFNTQSAWLHGSSRPSLAASAPAASLRLSYLSDNAVSNARVTGFNR